jgi:hypothetical protein
VFLIVVVDDDGYDDNNNNNNNNINVFNNWLYSLCTSLLCQMKGKNTDTKFDHATYTLPV